VPTPPGILHLKSAAALIDEETILVTETLAGSGLFDDLVRRRRPHDVWASVVWASLHVHPR
jgi:hypothetical protein